MTLPLVVMIVAITFYKISVPHFFVFAKQRRVRQQQRSGRRGLPSEDRPTQPGDGRAVWLQ